MTLLAASLADWAHSLTPTLADLDLAKRSLADTLAVTLAARDDPVIEIAAPLPDAARWAAVGHVLDFDDLHMESTSHISVVCVPATLAVGGDALAYLAGAGVMARLGVALGWPHYDAGWHVTCTAGAPAAAVSASIALGLDRRQTAMAIALSLPGAGGVVRAFGSTAKCLQVGFAAEAGVRAARLVAAGATADPAAMEQWMQLVGGDPADVDFQGPAVPGGLAIKLYPCCYACQRPIDAVRRELPTGIDTSRVTDIEITTPATSVRPLIHNRPSTGLEAKFSLEYAVAAALLDTYPGFESFSDAAVLRQEAQDLVDKVHTTLQPGGDKLLGGEVHIRIKMDDSSAFEARLSLPHGSPQSPASGEAFAGKLLACGGGVPGLLDDLDWTRARALLAGAYPPGAADGEVLS